MSSEKLLLELLNILSAFLIALTWGLVFGVWFGFSVEISTLAFACVFAYRIIKDYVL